MVKKKLLSVALVAVTVCSMIFTGCGSSAENTGNDIGKTDTDAQAGNTAGDAADDVEKPEKITIMVDGTFNTKLADGQEEWINKWEEMTGIELEVIQPDHNAYYDVLGQTFASGSENWPDVVILGSSYYSGYAGEGALWDMTDAWNNSELKKNPNTDVSVVEGNMLDGHLYGLALSGGGGCMTFVRKQWLDNCGLDIPTTYEEYLEMLDAFTNGDPDGDGINGNTIGVSAAGFVGNEAPYTNYLPEFYQDAYPSFYQGEDGTWKDGFTEDSMKAAIERLQDAYNKGYIDKETLTNGTSNCRTKFYEGKFGVFTYWAGSWYQTLTDNLIKNNVDENLVELAPIAEVGAYLNREAPVWVIIDDGDGDNSREQAIFDAFIETMMDGDKVQTLWTYGAEDVHWSTKAESFTINAGTEKEKSYEYEDGQFHLKQSPNDPNSVWKKNAMDPALVICSLDNGFNDISSLAAEGNKFFTENCKDAPQSPTSETYTNESGTIYDAKLAAITSVVVDGGDVDAAMQTYVDTVGSIIDQCLAELNQ